MSAEIIEIPPTPKQASLDETNEAGVKMALHLNHDHPGQWEKEPFVVRRRTRWHMRPIWMGWDKRVRMCYLNLYHPLWLGQDGVIYREYENVFGSSYFLPAELFLRDGEGLLRVRNAIRALCPGH